MTLVEISEREVLEAAKAWATQTRGTDAFAMTQFEADLARSVALLEERERVEQALDTGTVPPSSLVFLPETLTGLPNAPSVTRAYPPLAEGQCHWETSDSKQIVAAAPDCPHVADSSTINDEGESGNAPVGELLSVDGVPPPRPGADPIIRPAKKLSRREQMIEDRRRSDRTGQHRDDIDYSTVEDPSAR